MATVLVRMRMVVLDRIIVRELNKRGYKLHYAAARFFQLLATHHRFGHATQLLRQLSTWGGRCVGS